MNILIRINKLKLILIWLILFTLPVISQYQEEENFVQFNLKKIPQSVKVYDTFYDSNGSVLGSRRLREVSYFNRQGKLVELVEFLYPQNPYYQRITYSYNEKGEKVLVRFYKSAETTAENLILPDTDKTGIITLNPNLKVSLLYSTTYKYSKNLKVETESYPDEENVSVKHFTNEEGGEKIVCFHRGEKSWETKSFPKEKGVKTEKTYYSNQKPNSLVVHFYDEKKRLYHVQWIVFKSVPNQSKPVQHIYYEQLARWDGDEKTTEAINYRESGSPGWKNVWQERDGLIQSATGYWRKETENSPNQPTWNWSSESKYQYEFDECGSWIKSSHLKRTSPDGEFSLTSVTKRVINYY